ncbi:MAG: NifB/NifX family molybdenum-iron cluster-binding protein [Candidatus Omnitrophica bacterium]|nr:NifB/NifX family molybdenum-iron cluster-binding protein [Candidatus Omnitrophota bacterium]
MKICVTSEGKTLDSKIDPRFGRCQYFVFVDTDTLDLEAVENPNMQFQGGAGIQSGQLMISRGVKAVLTGNVGPNAFQTLQAGGIKIYTGLSGKVRNAVENYKSGELKTTENPSVGSKFGMPGKNK